MKIKRLPFKARLKRRNLLQGQNRRKTAAAASKVMFFILSAGFWFPAQAEEIKIILNPYENVSWEEFGRYRANLHTHTTVSDGRMHPHEAVDMYHEWGYKILSITDHDNQNRNPGRLTFPWGKFSELKPGPEFERSLIFRIFGQEIRYPAGPRRRLENNIFLRGMFKLFGEEIEYEDRDPRELGMVPVKGNELSRHHHLGSYFNDFPGAGRLENSLKAITERSGLAVFFHPGRYDYPADWYTDLYERYPVLVGIEVYNTRDRYPKDRELWDSMLAALMPERTVWGFSNDDMHYELLAGYNWNIFLLPEPDVPGVKKAMREGSFYFVHSPRGQRGNPAGINKISVDNEKGIIHVDAEGFSRIEWISGGRTVHEGNSIKFRETENHARYLRAKIMCAEGRAVTKTQPFGLSVK